MKVKLVILLCLFFLLPLSIINADSEEKSSSLESNEISSTKTNEVSKTQSNEFSIKQSIEVSTSEEPLVESLKYRKNTQKDSENIKRVIKDANNYIKNNYSSQIPELTSTDYYPNSIIVNGKVHEANFSLYLLYGLIVYYNENEAMDMLKNSSQQISNHDESNENSSSNISSFTNNNASTDENSKISKALYIGYDLNGNLIVNPSISVKMAENLSKISNNQTIDDILYPLTINLNTNPASKINALERLYINAKLSLENSNRIDFNQKSTITNLVFKNKHGSNQGFAAPPLNYSYANKLSIQSEDISDFLKLIDIKSLPTNRVNGIAHFKGDNKNKGFDFFLNYQDDLDFTVKVMHIEVNDMGNSYRVSDKFSLISQQNKIQVKYNEIKKLNSINSPSHTCIGAMTYLNQNDFDVNVGSLGNRRDLRSIHGTNTILYELPYLVKNKTPIVAFFYIKNSEAPLPSPDGKLDIKSNDFDADKAIPSGKEVKILGQISSSVLAEYSISEEVYNGDLSVNIKSSHIYDYSNDKEFQGMLLDKYKKVGSIPISASYYKLRSYSIYHLSEIEVYNEKLKPQGFIKLDVPTIKDSIAKVYSNNIVDISFDFPDKINNYNISSSQGINIQNANDVGSSYISDEDVDTIINEVRQNIRITVKNDKLVLGGQVILDDSIRGSYGAKPNEFKPILTNVIKDNNLIKAITQNGKAPSHMKLIYKKIGGEGENEKSFEISGNQLFVHTPIVNKVNSIEDKIFDQRLSSQIASAPKNIIAAPKDHIMKIELSSKGNHIKQKGYGNKDYAEYIKHKSIKLGFDSYVSLNKFDLHDLLPDKKYYLEAGKELKFDKNAKELFYKPAPWAKEGESKIRITSVAINAGKSAAAQDKANLSHKAHAAFSETEVVVTGRLYDFKVEKLTDPAFLGGYWKSGHKNKEGRKQIESSNGENAENKESYKTSLPINLNKHNLSLNYDSNVKLGYPIIFSLKTMGNYFHENDYIDVKVKFFHIDSSGTINHKIALYYRDEDCETKNNLIKIGSKDDKFIKFMNLKDFSSEEDLIAIENGKLALKAYESISKSKLETRRISETVSTDIRSKFLPCKSDIYAHKTKVPNLAYKSNLCLLSYPFRTFIGPEENMPYGVPSHKALLSIQKWKGSYSLPASTTAYKIEKDGSVNLNNPLKSGALGVSFDIRFSRNIDLRNSELAYVSERANQFINQGYESQQDGVNYPSGTIIIYDLNGSAENNLSIN